MVAQSATRKARADDDDPDDGIIRIGGNPETSRRDVLFTLDGEEYTVLANPPASLMLTYFDKIRKNGVNVAFSWALEEMVGEDGYSALLNSPKVSADDFQAVARAVLMIINGVQEGMQIPKSRRNGSRPRTG